MTDYTATPEQWADTEHWAYQRNGQTQACILELRARVETLEAAAHKHILETNSNILALFSRVESLEAAERQASKVYQISKPLRLTAEQQAELQALLTPNFRVGMTPTSTSNQVDSSLVDRVARAIGRDDEPINWEEEARAAIRPLAPSLKKRVSKALDRVPGPGSDSAYLRQWSRAEAASLINDVRRALEALPND